MRKLCMVALCCLALSGCKSASQQAREQADASAYKPVEYVNASVPGPQVVVLPGSIKAMGATFTQKVSENNIADFAEIELGKANFTVLERGDLGPMLNEVQVAAGLGDAETLKTFRRGKFKATRWLLRFDVLKAEPVAAAKTSFDGAYLGAIAAGIISSTNSNNAGLATAVGSAAASAKNADEVQIWLVGLRYKILDAVTGEQAATGYFEEKMEIGQKMVSFMGITQAKGQSMGLDNMTQILVQKAVMEIDEKYKVNQPPPPVVEEAKIPQEPEPKAEKPAKGHAKGKGAAKTEEAEVKAAPVVSGNVETTPEGGLRMDAETYSKLRQSVASQQPEADTEPEQQTKRKKK